MKSFCFFFLTLFLFSTFSDARRFEVGGTGAWVSNPSENYQTWAQKSRFQVHDTLYFNYAKGADSVLEVNKADFDGCNTKNPIQKMEDGESEVSLDRSGPFYFISGNEDNCKKGQKLSVVVISSRTSSTAPPPGAAQSPKSMASPPSPPKPSTPVSPSSAPVTSPPGSMAPKSSSGSPSSAPMTSPPGPMAPESSSPGTSPPAPMAPESSSPSSAPGSMAPKSSSAMSPTMAPMEPPSSPSTESPPSPSPSGSGMGPSGGAPSNSGDITTPSGAPGDKKSSANGIVVISVTTLLSLVLAILLLSV